jgi:hypothetical protein
MTKIDRLRIELGQQVDKLNNLYFEMIKTKNVAAALAKELEDTLRSEINKPRIAITDCEFGG